ncbi:MAG: aspartate-semialdehyde dehydrogenase [bacterium]
MKKNNLAIVGATGLVGQEFINILEERDFPIDQLFLFASEKSLGETVRFRRKEIDVVPLTKETATSKKIDIALFSAGSEVSLEFAKIFAEKGSFVIDNSSAFRMDNSVPLIVPEANGETLKSNNSKIIANPNCSTIQLVGFLKIVNDLFGLKKVVVSTYQSVSGAGKKGIDELREQVGALFCGKSAHPEVFPQRIAFNLIPHIGRFYSDGYCDEEVKVIDETRKILSLPTLDIDVTAVRVPTFFSHAESVNIELKKKCNLKLLREKVSESSEMVLLDDFEQLLYPTLLDSSGKNEVFIGRLRCGREDDKRISAWIVADNVKKGAAYNAVKIAEILTGGVDE